MTNVVAHSPIAAVMVHVANVEQALSWYEQAFPGASRRVAPGTSFEFLQVGNVQLELVPSDEKGRSGAAGSVVYWNVAALKESIAHFASLGAQVYRGPMQIEAKLGMCQVRDPWGNCIGLRGAYEEGAEP
jgi:predicted enzyme related to lactoylglutathione lyase